jgi:hypothetical protein
MTACAFTRHLRNFCADHPALSSYCAAAFRKTVKKPVFIEEKQSFPAWHGNCPTELDINNIWMPMASDYEQPR